MVKCMHNRREKSMQSHLLSEKEINPSTIEMKKEKL